MEDKINTLKNTFDKYIESTKDLEELERIRVKYLGKNGIINTLTKGLKELDPKDKKRYGPPINKLKTEIKDGIDTATNKLASYQASKLDFIDWTVPGDKLKIGHLHPTTQILRELNDFFTYFGYSVVDGPEIETDEYNFEKLNLPPDHPARDQQDTLYIKRPSIMMRTHTSSVETRTMVKYGPPIRVVVPGKCFRNETTNKSNNVIFYQYEALVIDKGITMAHLKWSARSFMQQLFGKDVILRFRCKYYPQVEPGMGIDMQCTFCKGKGCPICKRTGWLEIGGSGMVHPKALRACGIDPNIWSGFAFGVSPDRSAMQKFGIKDIRKLYDGSIVYK